MLPAVSIPWDWMLAVAGTLGVLGGGGSVFWWLVKPRVEAWARREIIQPVQSTHRHVTQNSHQVPGDPTLPDRMSDLQVGIDGALQGLEDLKQIVLASTVAENQEHERIWRAIEADRRLARSRELTRPRPDASTSP